MTAGPRDPRIDPRPGDVVRNKATRRVVAVHHQLNRYVEVEYEPAVYGIKYCSLPRWRRWAKNGEVIHAVE